jgi:hypothetical protein
METTASAQTSRAPPVRRPIILVHGTWGRGFFPESVNSVGRLSARCRHEPGQMTLRGAPGWLALERWTMNVPLPFGSREDRMSCHGGAHRIDETAVIDSTIFWMRPGPKSSSSPRDFSPKQRECSSPRWRRHTSSD